MAEKTKTKKKLVTSKKQYYFPELNRVVEAENITEALGQITKEAKPKNKEQKVTK